MQRVRMALLFALTSASMGCGTTATTPTTPPVDASVADSGDSGDGGEGCTSWPPEANTYDAAAPPAERGCNPTQTGHGDVCLLSEYKLGCAGFGDAPPGLGCK